MYKDIQKVFTAYEVRKVVSNMKWSSYRGPDELPAHFYHHNWDTLGKDIMNHTLNILNNKGDCSHINQTYIFLIPKKTNPQVPSDYRGLGKTKGIGFWKMTNFNDALLAKKMWRMIFHQDTLIHKCLKEKYFPNASILKEKFKHLDKLGAVEDSIN